MSQDAMLNTSHSNTRILTLNRAVEHLAKQKFEKSILQGEPPGRIAVTMKGSIQMIELKDILFIEADSNYCTFYTTCGKSIMVAKTLKEVNAKLLSAGFLRVHQSFLIHPSMVLQYFSKERCIVLKTGNRIPVSRANCKWVANVLLQMSF